MIRRAHLGGRWHHGICLQTFQRRIDATGHGAALNPEVSRGGASRVSWAKADGQFEWTKGPRVLGWRGTYFCLKNGRANNAGKSAKWGHNGSKGKGPLKIQFLSDDTKKRVYILFRDYSIVVPCCIQNITCHCIQTSAATIHQHLLEHGGGTVRNSAGGANVVQPSLVDPESYALRGTRKKKNGPGGNLNNFASGFANFWLWRFETECSTTCWRRQKIARLFVCAGEKSQSSNLSEYIWREGHSWAFTCFGGLSLFILTASTTLMLTIHNSQFSLCLYVLSLFSDKPLRLLVPVRSWGHYPNTSPWRIA